MKTGEHDAGRFGAETESSTAGFRGLDGLGDPALTISPAEAQSEDELRQLGQQAGQVAATLSGLAVEEAAALVKRHAGLHVRFIEEGDSVTEECGWGRITALTHDQVVTRASAG